MYIYVYIYIYIIYAPTHNKRAHARTHAITHERTHRDEDGLHGAGAEACQKALGLAQPVLVPALGVGEQAREELERAEADGGLMARVCACVCGLYRERGGGWMGGVRVVTDCKVSINRTIPSFAIIHILVARQSFACIACIAGSAPWARRSRAWRRGRGRSRRPRAPPWCS
jgi:hypothetical protein